MDPVTLISFWLIAIILAATIIATVAPPNTLAHRAAVQVQGGGEAGAGVLGAVNKAVVGVAAPFVPGLAQAQQAISQVGAPPLSPVPLVRVPDPDVRPPADAAEASTDKPIKTWMLVLAGALLLAAAGALLYFAGPKRAEPTPGV